MFKRIKNMYAKFKDWLDSVNELEKQNLEAGIINVLHPFMGSYTYIDQETYKTYLEQKQKENDRKETLSRSNKKLKD